MALVLVLREHQDFYVRDDQFIMREIISDVEFEIEHVKTGTIFKINDRRGVEVLQDVVISAGAHPQKHLARVAITAPRSITILRGDRYRTPMETTA